MLITYLEVRDEIKFEEEHVGKNVTRFPSVSIIVPCYNEEDTVVRTVDSLLSLNYPKDKLTLILVDDGSTDNTWDTLQQFKDNPQISIFTKENGGKHTVLNFALENVTTDLVGCLDADSFVDAEALRKIVPYFDDETIMAVTPSIKVYEPKTVLQYVQKVEYSWGIFLRRMLSSIDALYVTPGPFSIFRTQVFKELGGYRKAHHTEDMELALRMQKNRYRIANSHGAHVYTVTPGKFSALYTQRVRWTYGFLNNAIDYRDMYFNTKYGNIGVFVLPVATISIFTTLFATGNMLMVGVHKLIDAISKYKAVGFHPGLPHLSFDWFFFNTGIISILSFLAFFMTLTILALSLRVANGKAKFSKEVVYYLVLYIFIVPTWLAKALYNTVMKRNISWR